MLRRLLRFDFLVPVILLAGMAQYGQVAYAALLSGQAPLWQLNPDLLYSAGPLRYVKDAVVLGVSLGWVAALPTLRVSAPMAHLIRSYLAWLVLLIGLGLVGFLLGYSPLTFLPAGLRWVLLLHASFGVFALSSCAPARRPHDRLLFWFLVAILIIDAWVVRLQFEHWSALLDLRLGESRLTGLFANAGVAALFALAIALLCWKLDGVGLKRRMLVSAGCFFLALSAGSRFAAFAILLVLLVQSWELVRTTDARFRRYANLLFLPLAAMILLITYQAISVQVGRGDAIRQQFDKGGRAANLLEVGAMLSTAESGELLFGRGLGVGTNTAIGAQLSAGTDPSQYRFNILIDNAFATTFFQIGLVGSVLFWFGIWRLFSAARRMTSDDRLLRFRLVVFIFLLTSVAGNPFEQYFLMMAYALILAFSTSALGPPSGIHRPVGLLAATPRGHSPEPVRALRTFGSATAASDVKGTKPI